jgi:hypothetical protein
MMRTLGLEPPRGRSSSARTSDPRAQVAAVGVASSIGRWERRDRAHTLTIFDLRIALEVQLDESRRPASPALDRSVISACARCVERRGFVSVTSFPGSPGPRPRGRSSPCGSCARGRA